VDKFKFAPASLNEKTVFGQGRVAFRRNKEKMCMQPSSDVVIQVDNISKAFGSLKAVNGLSFEVYRGEIFGLLGPNGAGKTTTLTIIDW
jgi:ABC-type glutathione transport system ATPase component